MQAFRQSGGRLFRIAILFVVVSVIALGLMAYFTSRALSDMKYLAMHDKPVPTEVYNRVMDNMKFDTVIGALSGVLIAIAARYGARETAQNIANGMAARNNPVGGQEGDKE